jgi:hypothetical protein
MTAANGRVFQVMHEMNNPRVVLLNFENELFFLPSLRSFLFQTEFWKKAHFVSSKAADLGSLKTVTRFLTHPQQRIS